MKSLPSTETATVVLHHSGSMRSSSSSEGNSEANAELDEPQIKRDPASTDTASSDQQTTEDTSRRHSEASAQKRRRVTRACDECRRKKIKCDGKQPCTHCTVYSYECTYDQPSHRRRNPAPQYTEALENRLGRAEAVIRMYLPSLDWNDPGLDQMLQQQGPMAASSRPQFSQTLEDKCLHQTSSNDANLESMVETTGQLDLDHKGHWDYHGGSSGLSFMRGVREKLLDSEQHTQTAEDDPQTKRQSPKSHIRVPTPPPFVGDEEGAVESPYDSTYIGADELPSKELARRLCTAALDDATAILKLVHQPTFYHRFDRIYDLPPESYDNEDHGFLPLLYVVIALGCLFATDPQSDLELKGYKSAIGVGYKYFWASRQLMDVTDCRDLTSLQAIVFMIMFLQCSAKLSTCYSFIGVALRSALRMGLHRSFKDNFSPIEAEVRKRVFCTIRKMDTYVGAMLGLPLTLSDDDVDQEYPTEVDDDKITADGIAPMPPGSIALMVAANANFRLSKILTKIVRNIYSLKSCQPLEGGRSRAYSVSYAKIREIEMDLQRWQESLPAQLQPGESGAPQNIRQQQLLRMSYAHAQMMLYRPFLHYVSSRNQSKPVNQRAYACGVACVSVSRNIIHITAEMKRRGLLEGSYWFTMYTTFFGVLSLAFFALENSGSPTCQEVMKDAREGKETLARLARRSMAADRCTSTLNALFEEIGVVMEKSNVQMEAAGRKRAASPIPATPTTAVPSDAEHGKATSKGASKSHGSTSSASGHRGSGAPRQRGMRLISQTGRPQNQKHQQNQSRSPPSQQNIPHRQQPSQPQEHQQQHRQQQQQHQMHQPSGMTSANPYMQSMPSESPSATSNASVFNNPPPQGQSHYGQQQYPFAPQQFQDLPYTDSISNLSNMMFPSDNPFHYPNQPMTTIEQNFGLNRDHVYPSQQQVPPHDMFFPTSSPSGPMSSDEHIDAQPFNSMPPYLSSHGNDGGSLGTVGSASNVGIGSGQEHSVPTSGVDMWNQQARSHGLAGMNFVDIFSDQEWQPPEQ